jgi:hypothetical protein
MLLSYRILFYRIIGRNRQAKPNMRYCTYRQASYVTHSILHVGLTVNLTGTKMCSFGEKRFILFRKKDLSVNDFFRNVYTEVKVHLCRPEPSSRLYKSTRLELFVQSCPLRYKSQVALPPDTIKLYWFVVPGTGTASHLCLPEPE